MAGDSSSNAAVASAQTGAAPLTVFAAPATGDEFNTIGERLVPKACFKVEDLLFDFGLSFIQPEMKDHLPKLAQLRNDHKVGDLFPPLSIFGHADPAGDDDLNKVLSGRRATAFYAMLVRDVDLWEGLFTPPVKDDDWGTRSIQTMLSTVQEPIAIDGIQGDETHKAIRAFQEANGLAADGTAGPATRKVLYRAYMDSLCGPDLKLDKAADFLGHNKDEGGKGDFQGCSEFNPLRVFSSGETANFAGQSDHTERNRENAPNRRVVALLFAPGRRVNPGSWPCPRAKEGVAACKKRFFPDADVRRSPQGDRREFEDTKDTFACRFYQIISDDSPCERVKPAPPVPVLLDVNPLILFAISESVLTAGAAPAAQSFVAASKAPAAASVTPLQDIVLVKKPYTNPKRVEVVLKTDKTFDGDGVLTVNDPNSILLFPTASSKVPLSFNGTDNRFKGALLDPLGSGVHLFAEGKAASASMGAFVMTLALSGGTKKPGPNAVGRMTAIELVLDIAAPRVNATTAPVLMPQAPAVTPATPADKFFLGRPITIQDTAKIQERAMLVVQPVKTSGFAALGKRLVLVHIGAGATTFAQENPSNTDVVIPSRNTFFSTNAPTTFFVEGTTESTKARDNSYQLGIDGLDGDGDRVSVTVVHSEIVSNRTLGDLHLVARVKEKPDRTSRSTFLPAPLIAGRNFPIEVRSFLLQATATAHRWTVQGGAAVTLTDADKLVLKMTATGLSTKLDDTTIEARITSDRGVFLRRHKLTAVQVTIDSVANGDMITKADNVNAIKNPACIPILTGADALDATKVAKVEMLSAFAVPQRLPTAPTAANPAGTPGVPGTPEVVGMLPASLTWTADDDRIAWWIVGDDGGQYTGKADFRNDEAAKRGTKIEVFGVSQGDVLIQPYSGGFGYGMFRANVAQLRKIKYRVNRIFTKTVAPVPASAGKPGKPGRTAHAPTGTHATAKDHIKVTNIYLRQLGVELIPDDSAEMAGKPPNANPKAGLAVTDPHIVAITRDSAGHFDVEVDVESLTFRAQDGGNLHAEGAVRINARNEIITIAYMQSLADTNALAQAEFTPTNHAPGGVLRERGVPSSSLTSKTGIPGDTPAVVLNMKILQAVSIGAQPPTPANGARNINLIWGIAVPTTAIDSFFARMRNVFGVPTNLDMVYGSTLAHEVGHVLGLRHRIPPNVKSSPSAKGFDPFPDGLGTPQRKNLMFPTANLLSAENLDIAQAKAIRFSEVLARNP